MKRLASGRSWFIVLLGSVLSLGFPAILRAEPFLALREGYKCSQCHLNKTGGGMRNAFGAVYAQTRLPTTVLGVGQDVAGAKPVASTADVSRFLRQGVFFDSWLADRTAIGGDFRFRYTKTSAPKAPNSESFDVQEGRIYLQFDLQPDLITFYVDETLGPSAAGSREIYGLIQNLPLGGYVKAGKLLLPYGIRIYDDTSFIRETTGFNYATPDTGVEVGLEPGPYSLSMSYTNGNAGGPETNQSKQLSLVNSLVYDNFRVGGSFSYNTSDTTRRMVYGPLGGLQLGRVGFLAEVDLIRDETKSTGAVRRQLAAFFETDIEVYRGVNLRAVYDFLDPDTSIAETARTRVSVGAQWFVSPGVELNVFYKSNDSVPQRPEERVDFLLAELHLYF